MDTSQLILPELVIADVETWQKLDACLENIGSELSWVKWKAQNEGSELMDLLSKTTKAGLSERLPTINARITKVKHFVELCVELLAEFAAIRKRLTLEIKSKELVGGFPDEKRVFEELVSQTIALAESAEKRAKQKDNVPTASLLIVLGIAGMEPFRLEPNRRLRLGRREQADIHIDHVSISRSHAMIMNQGTQLLVRDLDSTNGISLDGVNRQDEFLVSNNDSFYIGNVKLKFETASFPDFSENPGLFFYM